MKGCVCLQRKSKIKSLTCADIQRSEGHECFCAHSHRGIEQGWGKTAICETKRNTETGLTSPLPSPECDGSLGLPRVKSYHWWYALISVLCNSQITFISPNPRSFEGVLNVSDSLTLHLKTCQSLFYLQFLIFSMWWTSLRNLKVSFRSSLYMTAGLGLFLRKWLEFFPYQPSAAPPIQTICALYIY